MAARQTIAIIGATGSMGTAIAGALAGGNYRLLLLSTNIDRLLHLQSAIQSMVPTADMDVLHCIKDGCWEADIIILAIPAHAEAAVADNIKEVATQKIVISLSNPAPQEQVANAGMHTSAAELLQKALPWSKVVKAFNTIPAKDLASPGSNSHRVSYIAGNDEEAVQEVSRIVQAAGLVPVILGDLGMSRKLEIIRLKDLCSKRKIHN